MAATEVVRVRIDSDLKREASAVLAVMGLSVSDAIRLMLVRVVSDKNLPFDIRVPNVTTQAAMRNASEEQLEQFATVADLMSALNKDDAES
ncbi:type II toxin-antitoxin system RelB/DinJ family antitoxin [Sphingobium sp. CR2-8]|uniref:type II toxin-antitoxin system RelB/DinJ family antitoxin n=1 Tax=Sphingobium sp. CR2-8 TaxID=1306534 RepID=UPI002DBA5F5E|nr:type II toxin-antitoxin system RelB/DinJ family antitoxin [Sphingobium sp. CR2-8]MEC3912925.1 type II toxin-antitoxin system RelB/DinJ family antitoxin [Sphingobium sp. CR2-8]